MKVSEKIAEQLNGTLNQKTWGDILYNVKVWGAKGDGVTDDTSAIQSAIDAAYNAGGGIVAVPSGSYIVSQSLYQKTNVSVIGFGEAVFKASASLPTTSDIMKNANQGIRVDSDLYVENITFDGNNNSGRVTSLIAFGNMDRFKVVNCKFINTSYFGISIGRAKYGEIIDCYFSKTGNPVVTVEGGAAIWMGTILGEFTEYITVKDCIFEDLEWCGIYAIANHTVIDNCIFEDCKEAAIFSNETVSDIRITNNTIKNITRKYISSSGIEIGSKQVYIAGNNISYCQNSGITVTDTQNSIVEGNTINACGQDNVYYSQAAGIDVLTLSASPNQTDHLQIKNNRVMDTQTVKTQVHGITVDGAGAAATNVFIDGNDITGFTTKSIKFGAGKMGVGCYTNNNQGHDSALPKVGQIQTPGTTGTYAVTGLGFRPRRIDLQAMLPSATTIQMSDSVTIGAVTQGHWWVAGSTSRGSITSQAINIYDTAGVELTKANIQSYDDDGFTLNVTISSAQPFVRYVAYP